MAKPELSIVIVSFNTKDITIQCLDSIYKSLNDSNLPFEVVIVENASSDGSLQALQEYAQKHNNINVIESKENIGFGKGNNLGVNHAKGTYILLLNTDIIVVDDAIAKLYKFYKQHEAKVHFIGAKLLNKDMTPQDSAAAFYTPAVAAAALLLKGDYWPWRITRNSPNSTKRVDWVSGACILTKKEYYEAVGGFDKNIFMYMEEVDLLYRASKKGLTTWFYPKARFIHLGSSSSKGRTAPILQVYKGFLYFYRKHYSGFDVFLLKIMLKLKAVVALQIGRATKNAYLIKTYEEAYKLVDMV